LIVLIGKFGLGGIINGVGSSQDFGGQYKRGIAGILQHFLLGKQAGNF